MSRKLRVSIRKKSLIVTYRSHKAALESREHIEGILDEAAN
ncbi:MAG: hypothetical protein ABSB29_10115 [Nitrososphaerales archaeon]|jgi:hypothetical protein